MSARTYADGFGRWHAIVDDTSDGLNKAMNAMADELMERGPADLMRSEVLEYLNRNAITITTAEPDKVHFAEYETVKVVTA